MDGNMAAKQGPDRAQYGRPLDKTSTQYATLIRKKKFTIFEFACLQAGIDPTSFDGSFLSGEVEEIKLGPYIRELLGSITKEKGEDDGPPFEEPKFLLCGFSNVNLNLFDDKLTDKLEFSAEAYVKYCNNNELPCPISNGAKKISALGLPRNSIEYELLSGKNKFTIHEFALFYLGIIQNPETGFTTEELTAIHAMESMLMDFVNHYEESIEICADDVPF